MKGSKIKMIMIIRRKKLKNQTVHMKIQMEALNFQMKLRPLKQHNNLNILTVVT
jgi:hypothetical protein